MTDRDEDLNAVHGASPARIVVMKVGVHDSEPWSSIVQRKVAEESAVGFAFWGYGGTACHPVKQVQPFAAEEPSHPIQLLMVPTPSYHGGEWIPASHMSTDGVVWDLIPPGIVSTGRYALVIRGLTQVEEVVDIGQYDVAVGPSAGRPLPDYLRARIDKACARRARETRVSTLLPVVMRAELVPPFAVYLRTPGDKA